MNKTTLLASTAVGLYLCLAPANAQMKEEKSSPGAATSQPSEKMSEPKEKGTKGAAEKAEPKEKATKGAEKAPEPKDKATKGAAEKAPEPKDKATKGAAEKAPEPKDKATKGAAEKAPEPKDATKGAGAEPRDKAGSGSRVQLTEEKRSNVGQTLTKDGNLNRATNINVSVNIGTRLPRSVRLVALPASIISIVPEYRSYHYVVVEDRICIVEPSSYEIVEVIPISSGQTAGRGGPAATLVLSDEERSIILAEVDMGGGSTMGLGALTEGAEVPRDVQVRTFSDTVVQKVPKVKGYKFFTAENRVAIVDPQGTKVQLILESRR